MTADLLPDPAPKPPEGEPERPKPTLTLNLLHETESWCYRNDETRNYMDWQAAEIARLRAKLLEDAEPLIATTIALGRVARLEAEIARLKAKGVEDASQ